MGSTTKEELDNLGLNLKKVQEKFLNEWTGESFRKARLEDKENQENMLTEGTEKMKHLEETINQYHLQSEKNLEVLRQRAEEVANLERELRELQITAERLVEKRNQNQKHFEETECRLRKQHEEISAKEQSTSYKIKQFTKGTEYFKERLGLSFKKVDEEHLQFVFKYIDPKDEEKPFVFTVAITNQDKYYVKDCMPEVDGLAEMVDKLNSTNNFPCLLLP
ncbi:kinetochore-associated Ndc80 complex subunit spc25 [Desmophyllum pertusum]|uniref:Kinetochore protein SPC25 n=1 Tax=Desmophyllum pertusum TaxID=174260 RepID=A0A9W9ZS01_9CNID|nr:kinetochore-associated Ndc80 complex subunit spc25 [Desmophyllum pertusum]